MPLENGYSYWMNGLLALDQGLNALLAGSCDETLSSRTYRKAREAEERGAPTLWCDFEVVVDALFFWDKGGNGERHCQLANMAEMMAAHMPKAMALKMLMARTT